MTLSILVLLMAQIGTPHARPMPYAPGDHEFIIAGCPAEGTHVFAKDRIWAIAGSGVTVWTISEWNESQERIGEWNLRMLPVVSRHPRIELPEPRLLNESSDSGPMMRLVKCDSKGCRQL